MRVLTNCLKEGLFVLGFVLVVIAGMLLFAVLVRPLMVLAIAAMFVALVLSVFSARVRAWFESLARYGQQPTSTRDTP